MSNRDPWDDRAEQFDRHPLATTLLWSLGVLAIVLVLTAAIGLASTGSVFFQSGAAKLTNPARVQQKVYDPNNTIAQVAFFHDTCNRVRTDFANFKAAEFKLVTDQKASQTDDPIKAQQAQDQISQDTTNVVGTSQGLQNAANDYNSRSAQYTANPFKDAGLPYRIEVPSDPSALSTWTPPSCG